MNKETIELIKLGIDLAAAAAQGVTSAIEAKKLVERLVAEGRDPTDAEWATLNATTEALIQGIKEA